MTKDEKVKAIESMIPDVDFDFMSGKCPSDFGLNNYCKPGWCKDTCADCWIKSLEDTNGH